MKKIFSFSIILFFFLSALKSQNTFQPKQLAYESKGIVYNKEFAADLRGHTNGWAIALNFGKIKTYYKTRYYHFEFGELKHAREYRQSSDKQINGKTARSYIFGKQNSFYNLRVGIGHKKYFSEKAKKRGLAIGINYEFGATLGILKPYYLELEKIDSDPLSVEYHSVKYSEETAESFLNYSDIYGSSNFLKGFGESSLVPGAHAKLGVHFDWGAFDEYVKAFEVGIMADIYPRKVPIMVETEFLENQPFFINLYLNLHFGKRW